MRQWTPGVGLAPGVGLCLAAALGACDAPPAPDRPAAPPPADTPRARAVFQLQARLGGEPELSGLRQGSDDGKAVLCGEAATAGGPPTPFVLRGGYLVLPGDGSPEQFATLQAMCTEPGPDAP